MDAADQAQGAYAVDLEVLIQTPAMRPAGLEPHRLGCGPAANLYWTPAQLVTHHASGGCNLNPGDLLGTGTISASSPDGYGSLLEITGGGTRSIALASGETRAFLDDGDEIVLSAHAVAEGRRSIGFGACVGRIAPARALG